MAIPLVPRGLGAAGKAIAVLDTVAVSREPVSLSEISRRTGLSKATVHRALSALVAQGMIIRGRHGYRLGDRPHQWSYTALTMVEPHAVPALVDLHRRTGLATALTVLSGDAAVPLYRLHDRHQLSEIAPPMSRMPLHCTASGKTLLAFDTAAANHFLSHPTLEPYTARTITAPEDLATVLARTRAEGVGRAIGECQPRIWALAVPVTDRSQSTVAAIAVGGPRERVGSGDVEPLLRASAAALSGLLRAQQRFIVRNTASTDALGGA